MPIVYRNNKITVKDAQRIASKADSLINLYNFSSTLGIVYGKLLNDLMDYEIFNGKAIKALGKPAAIIRAYESSPGLWLFDDTDTNITFLVWSDEYKKNPWKGTCYEAITTPENVNDVGEAFERLIDYLKEQIAVMEELQDSNSPC